MCKPKDHFSNLLDLIKSGWEIDQPVLCGSMWHFNGKAVYHFVLRNNVEDTTTLLNLPFSVQIQEYLAESEIEVRSLS